MLEAANNNRQLIEQILQQLGQVFSDLTNATNNCGLLNGLAGDLLFLYQLNQYQSSSIQVDEQVFNDKLMFLQEHLALYTKHPDLNIGLSGQGWLLEYLNQDQGEDYDPEFCEQIDRLLLDCVGSQPWQGEIELVSGLGGITVYATKRQLKSGCLELCERLLTHYENALTQIDANTATWPQPSHSVYRFNKEKPDEPEYNLGLAHGVPGIIGAIIAMLSVPSLRQRAASLVTQGCNWLLTLARECDLGDDPATSSFTSCCDHSHHQDPKRNSRLGWCYGDLTIALTLARAGKALNQQAYIDKAKQLALHAAKRDKISAMVYDAGLCHGSAGLALAFQLLDNQLDMAELSDAANHWLSYTLDLYQQQNLAGFHAYDAQHHQYQAQTGLLSGYSGIGLCLLVALGQEPDWIDCLLMG